ncbi:hypothetical protein AMATHDRAFT_140334 [Amanita thiersii Skay4041]|uniref:Large ribosomal subunit protein mL40 n=1 Tax=Amanita thiersii Skay4041 TaxID=703135 RepID=A0A2A9NWU0_9AGAR|nr:hypothetical protein AMATHDRAFT_140334 [Amanita thiersii Skay4041]
MASLPLRRAPRIAAPPQTRTYAIKNEAVGDPKKEIIRKALFPSNIRNSATPTGTWRQDVGRAIQYAIPSVQAHETIERAWLLHRRHVRKQREEELTRKFECMRGAMEELERVDKWLYTEANKDEDPKARSAAEVALTKTLRTSEVRTMEARIRGLFPRELRIPTDTPPRTGWNYEWKPFPRPLWFVHPSHCLRSRS